MFFFAVFLSISSVFCCTNLIVTKGASAEGYNTFTYSADSHTLYGDLYFSPAADHRPTDTREIYEWETGKYLGSIPQALHTFNVAGNMNENGVAIGETTFGGIDGLQEQPGAILDYGSLIYIALERSISARSAISIITNLISEFGYQSEGESFTIGDANEIWILDLIGKGAYEKGAVWVATRIPDGSISGHANQARTQTFSWDDPDNAIYSPDVMTFAQKIGRYPLDGTKEDFDFSEAYNPINFEGARMCDARVWTYFRRFLGASKMDTYLPYVQGYDLTNGRMNLTYSTNGTKISLKELLDSMRDHFEDTPLQFDQDVGAGPYHLGYRWRPLTWEQDGKTYFHERSIGTQQTGWSFAAQLRGIAAEESGEPYKKRSILWYGLDDCTMSVHIPIFPTISTVNPSLVFVPGVQDMLTFSFNSTFWVFNLLSNFVYTDYQHLYPLVKAQIDSFHQNFTLAVADVDRTISELEPFGEGVVDDYLTQVVYQWVDTVTSQWLELFMTLFPQYVDGVHKWVNPDERNPNLEDIGYGAAWYARIAAETGDRYYDYSQNTSTNQTGLLHAVKADESPLRRNKRVKWL